MTPSSDRSAGRGGGADRRRRAEQGRPGELLGGEKGGRALGALVVTFGIDDAGAATEDLGAGGSDEVHGRFLSQAGDSAGSRTLPFYLPRCGKGRYHAP